MIKGSVHQEDIAILNVSALNNRARHYVKQKLIELKREMDKFTIILETNFSLSTTGRMTRQKMPAR